MMDERRKILSEKNHTDGVVSIMPWSQTIASLTVRHHVEESPIREEKESVRSFVVVDR